jgi:hypothetical protein
MIEIKKWFIIFMIIYKIDGLVSKPQKLTACSAKLDSGQIIDLKSLDSPNAPKYLNQNFNYIIIN